MRWLVNGCGQVLRRAPGHHRWFLLRNSAGGNDQNVNILMLLNDLVAGAELRRTCTVAGARQRGHEGE